jgi:alpha-glucosidase
MRATITTTNRRAVRIAGLVSVLGACRAPPQFAVATPSPANTERKAPLELVTAAGVLRLSVLAPGVVRVLLKRSSSTRVLASFAVEASMQASSVPYQLEERDGVLFVRTSELGVRISKQPLRVALLDVQGAVLSEQAAPIAWQDAGWACSWRLARGEQVYGLGDKVKGFDRRGQAFELWNTDAYGWKPDADPLYKSLPFLLFLNQGQAHGLFIDSPARAQLDVGKAVSDQFSYLAEAGDSLDYYLLSGPDPKRVVESYASLTGRMPLPPRWALGYHQSRYSYLSETEARSVAARLRADAIRATRSGSTSTTSSATRPSPSTRALSRTLAAWFKT